MACAQAFKSCSLGGYGTSDHEVVVAVMEAAAYADKW